MQDLRCIKTGHNLHVSGIFSIEKTNFFIKKTKISIEKLNISIKKVIISIKKLNIFIEKAIISIKKLIISIKKVIFFIKKMTFFSVFALFFSDESYLMYRLAACAGFWQDLFFRLNYLKAFFHHFEHDSLFAVGFCRYFEWAAEKRVFADVNKCLPGEFAGVLV